MSFQSENNFALVHNKKKQSTRFSCGIFFVILCLATGLGMSKYDHAVLLPVIVYEAAVRISNRPTNTQFWYLINILQVLHVSTCVRHHQGDFFWVPC
jgi:hypothetical protein